MKTKSLVAYLLISLLAAGLAGCDILSAGTSGQQPSGSIKASGVIEADQIAISPELSGRIAQIYVQEGDQVKAGDLLIKLEDDLLLKQQDGARAQLDAAQAQLRGAQAAVSAAQATRDAASASLDAASIQYQQVLADARFTYQPERAANWNQSTPNQVDIPAWYYRPEELISAAEAEVSRASESYQDELENYQDSVDDIGNEEFAQAEIRLAEAEAAYQVADELNDHQVGYQERDKIEDYISVLYDKAESELKAAQKAFDQILADPEYQDILEARARVSVAKECYEIAQDQLNTLLQGEFSLEVKAASAQVSVAEAGLAQADAQLLLAENNQQTAATTVQGAQSALDLIDLQLEKTQLSSPISGVILTRNIEPGEIIAAGYSALTIADLSKLTVTVYIPEDRYGQINLGDTANLYIDSFPDDVFEAKVIRIADQAEYTPRNVQTQEERQNTVYAVKLSVQNQDGKLKPGMPIDVLFQP
jgi:HlyD family secretion protein